MKRREGRLSITMEEIKQLGNPPTKKRSQRRNFRNILKYYKKNYGGVMREDLIELDLNFYFAVCRAERMGKIPEDSIPRRSKKRVRYGNNPIEYYRQHCPHLTCGQLSDNGYGGLYHALRKEGQSQLVPRKEGVYDDNPIEYYRQHYSHLTRGQLSKECGGLYQTLRRKGQLKLVPRKRNGELKNIIERKDKNTHSSSNVVLENLLSG